MRRRDFIAAGLAVAHATAQLATAAAHRDQETSNQRSSRAYPVIDVTDLYQPYQDPGDNTDLVHAYALRNVDLRAIVLDVTDGFRKPIADVPLLWRDPNGPREPGIVPVAQLNSIFDRTVPTAVSPYLPMRSLSDDVRWAPRHQQSGIELLLKTLDASPQPVEIVGFGSCRAIAAAYNREPALMRSKVARVHVCAGTASTHYELGRSQSHNAIPGGEWNVALDSIAFRRVLTSDLPIALYPCATVDGAFSYGKHNTYWNLPNRHFVRQLSPRLRNYMLYVFGRETRADFLRCIDDDALGEDHAGRALDEVHHVWETAVWLNVARLALIQRDGRWQWLPEEEIRAGEQRVRNSLEPCRLEVREDGRLAFELTKSGSNVEIFTRDDPEHYEMAMREAWIGFWSAIEVRGVA